jgi:hypothetical protein
MKNSSFPTSVKANDFRMILAEDDTEKLGGYQGKIMSVSGARVIPCLFRDG